MNVRLVECRSAISPSRLPGLDWAVNPYRGCAHSCTYCYAQDVTRFEMGQQWGEIVEIKSNFVQRLRRELEKGSRGVYGVGTVTDPYQPLEKKHELTRGSLSLLKRSGAKISILTKSDLVLRDLDILRSWPGAEVGVSFSCLDDGKARIVEPGAPSPSRRIKALSEISSEGVNSYLMLAPIIPDFEDSEDKLRGLVRMARDASVKTIMWDRFNPRPIALSRLKKSLASEGLNLREIDSEKWLSGATKTLRSECSSCGIRLVDAF